MGNTLKMLVAERAAKLERLALPTDRPAYRGSFVGQRWTRPGAQTVRKVSWTDRTTGEKKFGRVLGKPARVGEVVWDGKAWVKA